MYKSNAFSRIIHLVSLVNYAYEQKNVAMVNLALKNMSMYQSRGKNKTKSHPKPHAHMALVRAARKAKNHG